jgi:hypothetical protein
MERFEQPYFFTSKYERHLLLSKNFVENKSLEEIFDILLDFGFKTRLDLSRFDHDQNLVEFVQDLNIDNDDECQDQCVDGCDLYH